LHALEHGGLSILQTLGLNNSAHSFADSDLSSLAAIEEETQKDRGMVSFTSAAKTTQFSEVVLSRLRRTHMALEAAT
jgi:hypothetical protein